MCGNGVLELGEMCDDGNQLRGDGCNGCNFECLWHGACEDRQPCNGPDWCGPSHTCQHGPPLPNGTVVPSPFYHRKAVCVDGERVQSRCGDSYVDVDRLETCEPPEPGCSAVSCTRIVGGCGDGVVSATEQCDDNNTTQQDGCSADCQLEQVLRVTRVSINGPLNACDLTGDLIPDNALGRSLAAGPLILMNQALQSSVDRIETNQLIQLTRLEDIGGQEDPSFRFAFFGGVVREYPQLGFDESVRWWGWALDYLPGRTPAWVLNASVSGGRVTTGTGRVMLRITEGWNDRALDLLRASVTGTLVRDSRTGRVSGFGTSGTLGRLCGAVTVRSLDQWTQIDNLPAGCGNDPRRSLLDILALGCLGVSGLVIPTQPDVDTGGDGIWGALFGAPFRDTNGDGIIDECRDGNAGRILRGDDCAQDPAMDDAYSVAVTFAATPAPFLGVQY